MLMKLVALAALSLLIAGCGKPLGKEQAQEALKRYIAVDFQVQQVRQVPEIPGLYEVVLKANKQPLVVYLDQKGHYVLSGTLTALDTGKNLTLETQNKLLQK